MKKRYHSITDIVATVYCEQKAVFDRERGDVRPLDVRAKAAAGTFEHLRFQVEGRSQQVIDKRCFIATQVYGPTAWQTDTLRAWRDGALRRSSAGRFGIACYYTVSPSVARYLANSPLASRIARWLLDRIVHRMEALRCKH